MQKLLLLIALLLPSIMYSQSGSSILLNARRIYIVDSTLIDPEFENQTHNLSADLIHSKVSIQDRKIIEKYGSPNHFDEVVFITTKASLNRPDSLKNLPVFERDIVTNQDNLKWKHSTNNQLYSGRYVAYHFNGLIKSYGKMQNGLMEGYSVKYYSNGKINSYTHYNEGKLEGDFLEFYENGVSKLKGVYKNGLKSGIWESWFENGIKESEIPFDQGFKNGDAKYWYSSGMFKQVLKYELNKPMYSKLQNKIDVLLNASWADFMGYGLVNSAINNMNKVLEVDSLNSWAYFSKGVFLLDKKEFDKSLACLNTALKIDPDLIEANLSRIRLFLVKNNVKIEENIQQKKKLTDEQQIEFLLAKEIKIEQTDREVICKDINTLLQNRRFLAKKLLNELSNRLCE